jgi:hypothetical protein
VWNVRRFLRDSRPTQKSHPDPHLVVKLAKVKEELFKRLGRVAVAQLEAPLSQPKISLVSTV